MNNVLFTQSFSNLPQSKVFRCPNGAIKLDLLTLSKLRAHAYTLSRLPDCLKVS